MQQIKSALVSHYQKGVVTAGDISVPSRRVLVILLVCAGYYAGALIAKSLRFPDSHLSLMWPPTAIVLAALLLAPPRKWWMYLVAVSPVHIFVQLPLTAFSISQKERFLAVLEMTAMRTSC